MSARRLAAVAVVACLVLAATGCGGSGGPRPDLLLVSTRDGDYAIYELDADGSSQRRLTESDADSSDGQAVFFQVEPSWSPDAARIAFSSKRGASFDIYTMLADGTGSRRLTSTKDNDTHPTWSPDGRSIAFARSASRDVYVMNADGSGARRLTKTLAEEADPAWSPDGNWIAYTRRIPGTSIREVWVIHPDGSGARQVTGLGRTIFTPTWSPDSKLIAFAVDFEGRYDIFSVNLEGEERTRYTQSTSDAFEPAWSPDGSMIAFSRDGAIETVTMEGSVEEITDPADNDSSPAWNPVPAIEEDEDS